MDTHGTKRSSSGAVGLLNSLSINLRLFGNHGGIHRLLSGSGLVILILMLASYVLAQKITIEFDETADFSKYKTFAIRGGQMNSRNPALNNELIQKNIESYIQKALEAKGLAMVTGPSDLNVRYQFGSVQKMETEAYPAGWRGWGTQVVRKPYAEGTLVVDLRDGGTRSLVWRGIASEENHDPAKLREKLDDMVKKAIAKYPPKKK